MQLNLVEVSFHLKMCRKLGALLADRNAEFKNTFCNDTWSQRDLSIYDRITVAKTLGLSELLFSSACIFTPVHAIDILIP